MSELNLVHGDVNNNYTNGANSVKSNVDTLPTDQNGNLNTLNTSPLVVEDSEYYNGKCGLFGFNPRFLQFFNSPKAFLISLGIYVILQGSIATGFTSTSLSSIEQRYSLSSTLVGFAVISYELGVIISLPFTSYFGARTHKPRFLGISLLIMGIGSLVFASPLAISGVYAAGQVAFSLELCQDSLNFTTSCQTPEISYYPLFILGNMLVGIGAGPLYTVGVGYLDDSASPKFSPIYLSLFYVMSIIGPVFGFVLGGFFLSIYVEPWNETNLSSDSPLYVGAWWLGFVLSGLFAIFSSFHFFLYPRRLKGAREADTLRREEIELQSKGALLEEDHKVSFIQKVKEYPIYILRLLKNPTFMLVSFGITAGAFILSATVTFLPKYMEEQFGLTSSLSAYIIGAISIPCYCSGLVIGGLIVFFAKLSVKRLSFVVFILTFVSIFGPLAFIFECPSYNIVGVTTPYKNSTAVTNFRIVSLNETCFTSCNCMSRFYNPVCGKGTNELFFSPCLAGCTDSVNIGNNNDSLEFHNCACLNSNTSEQVLSSSYCTYDCLSHLISFLIFLGIAEILLAINVIPYFKLTLRCVADSDRSVALGFQSLIYRLFGQLPGPLIFGVIFDANCILREETSCGAEGSCLEYNKLTLKISGIIFLFIGSLVSITLFFFAWLSWREPVKDTNKYNVAEAVKETSFTSPD